MRYLDSFEELNEKKNYKTKYEIFRDTEDKLKTKIFKAKRELEKIKENDNEDSLTVKNLKKDIKNIDIRKLELDFEINSLKYKKDYINTKIKEIKKNKSS